MYAQRSHAPSYWSPSHPRFLQQMNGTSAGPTLSRGTAPSHDTLRASRGVIALPVSSRAPSTSTVPASYSSRDSVNGARRIVRTDERAQAPERSAPARHLSQAAPQSPSNASGLRGQLSGAFNVLCHGHRTEPELVRKLLPGELTSALSQDGSESELQQLRSENEGLHEAISERNDRIECLQARLRSLETAIGCVGTKLVEQEASCFRWPRCRHDYEAGCR